MKNEFINEDFELLKEKYARHEQILIQAFKTLKQKEKTLKVLNQELQSNKDEIQTANEELRAINEELFDKNEIINQKNTDLEKALEELKDTQSKLFESEKMASLGILTAGVAHEINNPLNFIQGSYHGLVNYFKNNKAELDADVQVFLDSIKTGVEKVAKIVTGLNQFSRDNDSCNEKCNIHEIIDNCLIMMQNQLKKGVLINKKFNATKYLVGGNVGKLHQVFVNILINANQAIEGDGDIIIETKNTADSIIVCIIDNGCGITEENLTKITDPFFTTKEPGQGTGLGLSLTYKIIKQHKGKLKIHSKLNKGTQVNITLPLKSY